MLMHRNESEIETVTGKRFDVVTAVTIKKSGAIRMITGKARIVELS